MKNTRFLIASGGTGGHFYPGFALGKALHSQGNDVLFVVRQNDPAISTLAFNGLAYEQIDLKGLPRSLNPIQHIRFASKLVKALMQTRKIIKSFRPNVTLGMGGYVSFPLIFCSHFMGIRTTVHESNAIWGLSNKICATFADLRLMGLPMQKTFKNAILSSTPIRKEFGEQVSRQEVLSQLGLKADVSTILIVGGSQGAKGLNEALPQVIKNNPQWQFIHLTGKRWYEQQQTAYHGLSNVKTLAYSEEIYKLMKSVDLIICRSGASTLAEIIACHLPAILVPFPYAAANHQYFNAKVLADAGCATVVLEGPQFTSQLGKAISALTSEKIVTMRHAYEELDVPNPLQATRQITELLTQL